MVPKCGIGDISIILANPFRSPFLTDSFNPALPVAQNSAALVTAWVDGELIALSIERGAYYHLGDTGSRIWALMDQPATVASLVGHLREEFDVDAHTCEREVTEFLTFLWAEGLLVAASEHAA